MPSYFPRALATAIVLAIGAAPAVAQEQARTVAGGGITVAGWLGQVDPSEASRGQVITNSRFARDGQGLRVTTGPAAVYWNPANRAAGNYTVRATFHEPEYMNVNDHPHPYGIVIGGSDLGTPNARYLYCAAYGNGSFIVRGFGPAPFQMNGRRGEVNAAVHSAEGKGKPVTQEIAVAVQGDQVSCTINGTQVASYPKSAVIGDAKLASTDGLWGVRFAHNTDAIVTGLKMEKP